MTDVPAPPTPVTALLRAPRHRVSPRARLMWQVAALVEGAVAIGVLLLVDLAVDQVDLPWWGVVAAVAAVLAWVAVVPQWRYAVHRWEVTETAVHTQSGWWAQEQRIAPLSRIQTVDRAEGAVARVFGLATVTVTTASAAGALEIDGLDRARAQDLVAELTLKADAVEGDAT
ncbi:PH domain-containing protein [Nocardioides sp. SOB77]|uniref:PH domain-containing protein n=1 Tax=Nocardioides oceani TaxID=3058369 RepID=A0ABT8FGG3_9ACTN|nr:PH domain-containing protein [Nocardioides oceani]MDN4173620.1 PH domain-containing protein [Nocardioides oceani]